MEGILRFLECHYCARNYAINWQHCCENKQLAVPRDYEHLDITTKAFFIKHYGTTLQLPKLAFIGKVPDSEYFTDDVFMQLENEFQRAMQDALTSSN